MAFLLPHLALAPAQCGPTYCAPRYTRRAPRPSFASFLSIVDDTLNEFHREAQREATRHVRRQAFNPKFDIKEREEGYEVEAEVPGFEQESIDIEVTDEQTLRIRGNTEKVAPIDSQGPITHGTTSTAEAEKIGAELPETSNEPRENDTESVKSHQATVEDDFEDLGAETSSMVSHASATSSPSTTKEEVSEATEPATVDTTTQQHPHQREWLSERVHGSFERTFRFPSRIDGASVRAQLKNGVLYIAVPKAPVPEVHHVTIQ